MGRKRVDLTTEAGRALHAAVDGESTEGATITTRAKREVVGPKTLERVQGHVLKIVHVPTGFAVKMPAFLDSFSDAYSSTWSEQPAFGRMDSAATFSSTRRNISIAWNLPAESFDHARRNLGKINALLSFLYPLYDVKGKDKDPVINMDPILRLSFGNLVRDPKTGKGLMGYVNGITFDPVVSEGMFNGKPSIKTKSGQTQGHGSSLTRQTVGQGASSRQFNREAGGNPQNNVYYPKTVRLNIEFRVLHEHSLGFAVSSTPIGATSARASYAFSDPALNFTNFPITTTALTKDFKNKEGRSMPGGDRATRGSWPGGVTRIPTGRGNQGDPAAPGVILTNEAVPMQPGAPATQGSAIPYADKKGQEKAHVPVVDRNTGRPIGGERSQ